MNLPPLLIQTAGSLAAILALSGLAWWLKLGGAPLLASDEAVRRAAGEVADGFAPVAIARDRGGLAALVRDEAGRIMLIRRHGNRFAGRVLDARATARVSGDALAVASGEWPFGTVRLELGQAQAWADAINALGLPHHA